MRVRSSQMPPEIPRQKWSLVSKTVHLSFYSCCRLSHIVVSFFTARFLVLSLFILMYLWWSVRTWYLHACQVGVTVDDSGLCCVCFER